MADIDDVEDALVENVQGAKRMQSSAGSVESQPGADQIAAIEYLRGTQAATRPGAGLRFQQITPVYR